MLDSRHAMSPFIRQLMQEEHESQHSNKTGHTTEHDSNNDSSVTKGGDSECNHSKGGQSECCDCFDSSKDTVIKDIVSQTSDLHVQCEGGSEVKANCGEPSSKDDSSEKQKKSKKAPTKEERLGNSSCLFVLCSFYTIK